MHEFFEDYECAVLLRSKTSINGIPDSEDLARQIFGWFDSISLAVKVERSLAKQDGNDQDRLKTLHEVYTYMSINLHE